MKKIHPLYTNYTKGRIANKPTLLSALLSDQQFVSSTFPVVLSAAPIKATAPLVVPAVQLPIPYFLRGPGTAC